MVSRARDEHVYARIAMLRTERGLSRAALADAAGVHYQTIGYIERGEFAPSLAVALRLAALFELPVEAVFSLTPFAPLTGAQLTGTRLTGDPTVREDVMTQAAIGFSSAAFALPDVDAGE